MSFIFFGECGFGSKRKHSLRADAEADMRVDRRLNQEKAKSREAGQASHGLRTVALRTCLRGVAAFAVAIGTSAQAMSPPPLQQLDGMTTQVAYGCGVGRTRV